MRAPSQPYSGLEVVMVGRAGRYYPVSLKTSALHIGLHRASFECSVFKVITHPVVQREVRPYFPRILNVEAVDVVCGVNLRRANSDLELCWKARIGSRTRETFVKTEMELGEQREVREVTDVEPGLHRMRAVGPGKIINKLVAILIGTLWAAERSSNVKVRALLAG